jgi:hypothetical protein
MGVTQFIMLLASFSIITSLIVECVKKIVTDKANISYNLTALIVAMIVGTVGCCIYYQLNTIPFTINNIIYIVLMGFASALTSTLGYDKVKQCIMQITNKTI